MRYAVLFLTLYITQASLFAQKFCNFQAAHYQHTTNETLDSRADTFDVLSYEINAAFLDYQTQKSIDASTIIKTVLLEKSNTMRLDLLSLNVSQVQVNNVDVFFLYLSPSLLLDVSHINRGDTFEVYVKYSGEPKRDPQWGGFYFTGEYAFNLGVGFASDPHNFGRVWFPCFDNFTDRAEYFTHITVDTGYRAYANGYLNATENNGDGTITYKWTMDEPIPTYLASVAIAAYEEVKYNLDGIPVLLTALKEDTANLRSSFENIPACIRQFEEVYGDHTFDRIGFNIVPFNSGAMEHATNIAYPRYAIANGGKQNETLYAHELAHHWWGNTTTCGTQEDMWLNEGWASYSERIFLEAVYGREAYNEDIEANHKRVLQFAHIQDGDVLPVSGIGHSNTYGRHVYNKGADMVHSLRGMMGDDGFFEACGSFQQRYKLQDVSTDDMKAHFQKYTSLDLTGFFEQWIKEAGFAHMDIVQAYKQADRYHLRIKQTPRFNELVYTNLKVQLTAFAADRSRWDTTIVIDQAQQDIVANCPLDAVYWSLDFDDKISDATTTDWAIVSDTTIAKWNYGMMSNIVVDAPSADSMLLHITHHWAPADGTYGVPVGARLSRERYWSVGGVWQDETVVSAEIAYNGLTSTQQEFGYLDTDLIRITEDSLVLLYRSHASAEWQVADNYTKTMGSLFDKRGTIQINNLKQGQYALAMYDAQLATVKAPEKSAAKYKVYPNPTDNVLIISFNDKPTTGIVEITDSLGKVVLKEQLNEVSETYLIDVSGLVPGTYFVGVVIDQQAYNLQKIVVK